MTKSNSHIKNLPAIKSYITKKFIDLRTGYYIQINISIITLEFILVCKVKVIYRYLYTDYYI